MQAQLEGVRVPAWEGGKSKGRRHCWNGSARLGTERGRGTRPMPGLLCSRAPVLLCSQPPGRGRMCAGLAG